jgi:OmpA-OmpF porin, OOP family
MKTVRSAVSISVLLATAAALPAQAASPDGAGVYIGLGAGISRAKIEDSNINAGLVSQGATSATTTKDENGTAYKAFVGYSFNRYIAIEGGYFDLGKFTFDSVTTPPGTLSGEIKVSGWNLDAVLSYPFGQGFSVFARAGVQNAESKVNLSGTGAVVVLRPEISETKTNWKAGVGAGYEFAQGFGLRGEWERYRVSDPTDTDNDSDVDVLSLSVYYKF